MTLNSNHVGNLKDYFDPYYDTREEAQDKLALKSDVLHRHEDDLSPLEALIMFIGYVPVFHVHMTDEILELKEELDKYSDVDHTHPEFYLMVEVDAQWAHLRALLEATIGLKAEIVQELPENPQEGMMYIIEKTPGKEGETNTYDEYIYYQGEWELVDTGLEPLHVLNDYAKVDQVTAALETLAKFTHVHEKYVTIVDFDNKLSEKADNVLATEEHKGLMSKEDFIKLKSVQDGANYTPVDSELSGESGNCVSSKAIAKVYNELDEKIKAAKARLDKIKDELEVIEIV